MQCMFRGKFKMSFLKIPHKQSLQKEKNYNNHNNDENTELPFCQKNQCFKNTFAWIKTWNNNDPAGLPGCVTSTTKHQSKSCLGMSRGN